MENRLLTDPDESLAYHARVIAAARAEQVARIAKGSRPGLVSRFALFLGDRMIVWGRALKKRAASRRPMPTVYTGYAD